MELYRNSLLEKKKLGGRSRGRQRAGDSLNWEKRGANIRGLPQERVDLKNIGGCDADEDETGRAREMTKDSTMLDKLEGRGVLVVASTKRSFYQEGERVVGSSCEVILKEKREKASRKRFNKEENTSSTREERGGGKGRKKKEKTYHLRTTGEGKLMINEVSFETSMIKDQSILVVCR